MKRINGDWLHWMLGDWGHVGFHRHGNCWRFVPSITRYSTVTYYSWWRLFVAVHG